MGKESDPLFKLDVGTPLTLEDLTKQGYKDLNVVMGNTKGSVYSVFGKSDYRLLMIQYDGEKDLKIYLKFKAYPVVRGDVL